MNNKCNKITLVCNKGGVGRSTTTINVGWYLASIGKKVIIVDLDAQANTSKTLAKDFEGQVLRNGANKNLTALVENERAVLDEYLVDTRHPNLKLLASEWSLDITEEKIKTTATPSHILAEKLEGIEEIADYVIFDTPPRKTDKLIHNALVISDWYWFIVGAEDLWSLDAKSAMDTILRSIRKLNKSLRGVPVLLTRYKANTLMSQSVSNAVDDLFVDVGQMKTKIRNTTHIPRAILSGKSIFEYSKKNSAASDVADDYVEATKELIKWVSK